MNHENFETLLPLYAAGQLTEAEYAEVEAHLPTCASCQANLKLWQAVSEEIRIANRALAAPPAPLALPARASVAERALEQIHAPNRLTVACLRAWQLLHAQAILVQREMWPTSALVMLMGVIVALISDRVSFIYFLAPLVAASSVAMLYGPENDSALELSLATPTSPWKILLARLSVVSGYNLLLSLGATFLLFSIAPPGLLGTIILGWLGPLTFLSALALLLSIWMGTNQAIAVTYSLWFLQYIPFTTIGSWLNSPGLASAMTFYRQFWQSPLLLLPLSLFLIGLAIWFANRPVFRLTSAPG